MHNLSFSGAYKALKILGILFFCQTLFAEGIIYTTHPQVAHSLNFIVDSHESQKERKLFRAVPLFGSMVNVHDFEPTTGDLKKLRMKGPLIAGPLEHQRWVFHARESGLLHPKHFLIKFKSKGSEHFWLEVERGCEFEKLVYSNLKSWDINLKENSDYCTWLKERKKEIQNLLKKKKFNKVILTHSALAIFMKDIELDVLVLRSDDHQKETPPKKLKRAYRWMKEKDKVLLIHEQGFSLPPQLKKAGFPMITWSPLEAKPQPLLRLQRVIEELGREK